MDHIAQVEANSQPNSTLRRLCSVALLQRPLNLHGAPSGFKRAAKLDEEAIADAIDLQATELAEQRPQEAPVLFKQFDGEWLIALCQRAVAHLVVNMMAASAMQA